MEAAKPYNLLSLSYLGPVYDVKKTERETLSLESNETPSFIPSCLLDTDKKESCAESVQVLFNRVLPTLSFKNDTAFIELIKIEIQDHVEIRLQLFWQQLLMVNKTNLDLNYSEHAQHQAGLTSQATTDLSLQEAHSSTLPCLLFLKDGKTHVFGAGSSFYKSQNTTVKVQSDVNRVDSWADKATKEFKGSSLRQDALQVLRDASKSDISLVKGFQRFVDLFLSRINKFDATHTAEGFPNQKLACRFYAEVVTSYKTRLAKDDTLIRTLCFEKRSKGPLDDAFFLKVQMGLHSQFIQEMRVQELQQKMDVARPLSNTQAVYAKIYLNSRELKLLLSSYFKNTNEDKLKKDWNNVVQITPQDLRGISPDLVKVINQAVALIKKTYEVGTIQKAGAIFQSMLFQASLELSPDVNALYALPDASSARVSTRSRTKKLAAVSPQATPQSPATPPPVPLTNEEIDDFFAWLHKSS